MFDDRRDLLSDIYYSFILIGILTHRHIVNNYNNQGTGLVLLLKDILNTIYLNSINSIQSSKSCI